MDWATRRQLLYALAVLLILTVVGASVWYFFIYTPASCTDSVLNQDEEGIDCGGVCAKLCRAPRVSAVWARAVEISPGVFHAVAMVRNPETGAGTKTLPYSFKLFDAKNILVAERTGVMQLNPGEVVPLLETNIVTRERIPVRTFVDFGVAQWVKGARVESPLRVIPGGLPDPATLLLTASVENKTALPVENIVLTALLYDAEDIVVTASQTTIDHLDPRETRDISFTWQQPFPRPVVRADVIPRLR